MSNLKKDSDYIKINLASPACIKKWGTRKLLNGLVVGEIKNPETINYKTFKPEINGLFCEKTFGPVKNWECFCGKYKWMETSKLLICDQCNVEITESKVRRHRMGFIKLNSPVIHVWYLKSIPSYLSLLLRYKLKILEEIVYFNRYLMFNKLEKSFIDFLTILKEPDSPKIGAEAIKNLLLKLDLKNEIIKDRLALSLLDYGYNLEKENENYIISGNREKRYKLIRRIRLVENFLATGSNPSWMILDIIPIIPPGLRPMIHLDGGRLVTSDLNELYRRVIIRNNRLKKMLKMGAPFVMIYNEKRMLQESIDSLIDNGKRGRKILCSNQRPLKSLSEIIAGKQGRFRQNLLGKRVDYSGRSVIIVGPSLKLNQCGLPHEIAFELFNPFIIQKLISNGLAKNMYLAQKLIKKREVVIWDFLKNVLEGYPILLNRAPTLHRLGIQSFEPILVPGRAIQLHPLVCTAFNADFDGDQMAIHIPLSYEARIEAKNLMLSPHNFLSSSTGEPIITPTQDVVLGCHYLTVDNPISKNYKNKYFSNYNDVLLAYTAKKILLHTPVWVKTSEIELLNKKNNKSIKKIQTSTLTKNSYFRTTPGRILLNLTISKNLYF